MLVLFVGSIAIDVVNGVRKCVIRVVIVSVDATNLARSDPRCHRSDVAILSGNWRVFPFTLLPISLENLLREWLAGWKSTCDE